MNRPDLMADILWVEDQTHWIDRFRPVLEAEAFDQQPTRLTVFRFAAAACQHIRQPGSTPPDLALLDAQMSGDDEAGFSVSRALQRQWPEVPILYLSEYSGTGIEEQAFEQTGARDFIAKHQPNIEQVLCWRIRAVLRGRQPASNDHLEQGPLRIDTRTWEVFWQGRKLMNPSNPQRPLGPTPRKILRYLVEASPRPLTTEQIADHLQADPGRFSWASYRQHIRTLRNAFDQAGGGDGRFMALCQRDQGLVTFGDAGAYCWKPVTEPDLVASS
ncbi:response regulator transcription factor [Natronospirillum operosum]|nr:response regulator [Natronospirillum operosum]